MREIPHHMPSLARSALQEATVQEDRLTPDRGVFVGRAESLVLLETALEQSRVASRSVVVSGEAGVGKTRLVQEFASWAETRPVHVAWGHCYSAKWAPPYLPFQQVIERLRCAGLIGRSKSFSGKDGTGDALLKERKGEPQEWRDRFLAGVSEELTSVAASQPLLLIIEDIQWADTGSLLLLNRLVDRAGCGLLVISTVRPDEPLERTRRQLLYSLQGKSIHLDLRGLTTQEIRELVTALYDPGFATEREIDFLHRFTRGNPLFVRELLDHLANEGMLDHGSIEEATVRHRIPLWLAGLLDLRLDALSARVRQLLSEASVLGDEFSLDMLSRVKQESAAAVEDLLDMGIRGGILRPGTGPLESRFRFVHPLYRKRLYESLQPSLRRAFHGSVARAALGREIDIPIEEQAAHLALAGEGVLRRRATTSCRRAAIKAERIYAYETAAWFWELALQSASPRRRRERADLLARLGWARWAAREWLRAREAWQEAIGLYEALQDSESIGPLALALGETARWQQDLREAEHWLRRALSLLPSGSETRARALAMLGSVACIREESAEGMALLQEARRTSGPKADPYALYWLSYGYQTLGDAETARMVAEEAFAAAQQMGDRYVGSLLATSLAQIHLSYLRLPSARRYVGFIRQTAEDSNMMVLSSLLISQSLLAAYGGHWEQVVRICEQTMGKLRLAGRYQFAASRFFRAEAKLALGEREAACAEMSRALPDLEQMRPAAALHLARALLHLGEFDEARRLVRHHAAALLDTRRMAAGRAILGEVAARLGEKDLAAQAYRFLANERRPLLLLYSPVSVQRVLAAIATSSEDWPKAIDHLKTAIEQLTRGGALGELVATYLDYAEMRRARRRRGDLTKALALEAKAAKLRAHLRIPAPVAAKGGAVDGRDTYGNRFALTGRELQVLRLVAEGRRNTEVAEALCISHRTVERHLENITAKMGVAGRVEAVVRAVQEGLVGPLVAGS